MKTLSRILLLFVVAGMFFTSCTPDDGSSAGDPTVVFTVGGTDVTVAPGATVTVAWDARKHPDAGKLTTFTILRDEIELTGIQTRKGNPIPYSIGGADDGAYVDTVDLTVPSTASSSFVYKFRVTDKDGNTDEAMFTVTTSAAPGPINTYSGVEIVASGNAAPASCFSAKDGKTYSSNPNHATNPPTQADIDLFYGWDASVSGVLGSPDDTKIYNLYKANLDAWTTKNKTNLRTASSIDQTAFDAIADDAAIISAYNAATGSNTSRIEGLMSGSTFIGKSYTFKTAGGKYGILIIKSVVNDLTGSVTIDVKVQQ